MSTLKARFGARARTAPVKVVAAGLAVALAGAALATAAVDAGRPAGVFKVSVEGDAALTRVVIDIDKATMVADPTFPARGQMVLNFAKTATAADGARLAGAGGGVVKQWAVDRADGQTRLKLDLDGEVTVAKRFLLPPGDGAGHWRYVIDLKPATRPAQMAANAAPAALTRLAAPLDRRRVVVIDAGHGGQDAGAHGGAAREKDVTLAAARALKARLEGSGRYRVLLTRDADVFVPLERRVQVARDAQADLFISLHADAGADADIRGASAYTLSEKGAERVAKVLSKDDLVVRTVGPGRDKAVGQIVLDLTQRSTKTRSAAFADVLLEKVGRAAPLLNRSHRDAGFMVLLAPETPAVLLEMGFITSPADERFLTRRADRERLVDAVGDAIDDYFENQVRLALG